MLTDERLDIGVGGKPADEVGDRDRQSLGDTALGQQRAERADERPPAASKAPSPYRGRAAADGGQDRLDRAGGQRVVDTGLAEELHQRRSGGGRQVALDRRQQPGQRGADDSAVCGDRFERGVGEDADGAGEGAAERLLDLGVGEEGGKRRRDVGAEKSPKADCRSKPFSPHR